ncbi:MAG TPA: pitrilysin family protein [Thermoanaerobaculia bacterium]|jgi:zinc protease
MKRLLPTILALALAVSAEAQFFPYPVQKRTLPNGLDVVVIETPEFKNVLSFNTLIVAGSGRENEKGRSGLAHLFEHIMFRHAHDTPQAYQPAMDEMGAFNNAFTWYDVTFYHPLTFTQNLDRLAALEGERFRDLRYSERVFRTEAGAVFGEYRRIASDPSLALEETLSDLTYGTAHGYGHSTIGYVADVQDMPNAYKSAVRFYDDYYRPNNAVVVIAGDVKAEDAFRAVEKSYGAWKQKATPTQPDPKPVAGPKKKHVDWESDIPPRVLVSYLAPAYVPGSTESSVMEVLPELISGETSPLYRKLRFEDQVASTMGIDNGSMAGLDARPFANWITVAKDKYDASGRTLLERVVNDVAAGTEGYANFSSMPGAAERLEAVKSRLRYDLLGSFNSPASIGLQFAMYYRFTRDPQVFEKIAAGIAAVKPADVDAFARKYLTPKNRVAVTLAGKEGAK